jgi:hypothetical protein
MRFAKRAAKRLLKLSRLFENPKANGSQCGSGLKHEVVLTFNPGEAHRVRPITEQLYARYGDRLAVALTSFDPTVASQLESLGLPVFSAPNSVDSAPGLAGQFIGALKQARHGVTCDELRELMDSLKFHFQSLCERRWPQQAALFRWWVRQWKVMHPSAVVVSGLEDSESQLPALAATHLGIPSLAFPHGTIYTRRTYLASRYILYPNQLSRRALIPLQREKSKLFPARDLLPDHEYPNSSVAKCATHQLLRILVLANPMGVSNCLAPYVRLRTQISALKSFDSPPGDLAASISVRVKLHPGKPFQGGELVALAAPRVASSVLPLDSAITDLIDQYDLFVSLNGYGSVLKPIVAAGKPIVLFWTDYNIGRAGPYELASDIAPAGSVVRSSAEFWQLVRGFLTDGLLRTEMARRSYEFARTTLDDRNYPRLGDILARLNESSHTAEENVAPTYSAWESTCRNDH